MSWVEDLKESVMLLVEDIMKMPLRTDVCLIIHTEVLIS